MMETMGMLNLGCAARLESERRALALAEAAANTALARLLSDPQRELTEPVRVTLPGDPVGAEGLLAFQADSARALGIPPSTHNLLSDTACPGSLDTVVPGRAVQLLGVGRCQGVERRLRLVVGMPDYPFVLASDGPVNAEEGVLIGSLSEPGPTGIAEPQALDPGDLACNGQGGEAVRLGPATLVAGDVSSTGGLVLDAAASAAVFPDPAGPTTT